MLQNKRTILKAESDFDGMGEMFRKYLPNGWQE